MYVVYVWKECPVRAICNKFVFKQLVHDTKDVTVAELSHLCNILQGGNEPHDNLDVGLFPQIIH